MKQDDEIKYCLLLMIYDKNNMRNNISSTQLTTFIVLSCVDVMVMFMEYNLWNTIYRQFQ